MVFLKYIRNLLFILLLAYIIVLTSKTVQIYLLYKMSALGSGWDDGAAYVFIENKVEYKPLILDMLNENEMSTYETLITFTFAEFLLDDEDVYSEIKKISESYPKKHVRCFWHDVLNGRFEQVPISSQQPSGDKNQFIAYRLVDQGTTCK